MRVYRASRSMINILREPRSRQVSSNAAASPSAIGAALSAASIGGKLLPPSHNLQLNSLEEAYLAQQAFIVGAVANNWRVAGWKIGATNEEAQRRMLLEAPFYGPIFQHNLATSPCTLPAGPAPRLRGVECEFVFRMARSLFPRDADYSAQEVLAAVDCVYPAIEVCASRFEVQPGSALLSIADQSSHGHLVGAPHLKVSAATWAARTSGGGGLKDFPVTLLVNGDVRARGDGTAVLRNPLTALTWLCNALQQGCGGSDGGDPGSSLAALPGMGAGGLREGDVVTTGTMTGLTPVAAGDAVLAEFEGFGVVRVAFAPPA